MYKCLIIFALFVTVAACNSNRSGKAANTAPTAAVSTNSAAKAYDLSTPLKKWNLPPELKEISGNTWMDKDHLIVIEDLHPNLYLINLASNASVEKVVPFETDKDKKFDIEDVTNIGDTIYALWSHGVIFKVTNWKGTPKSVTINTPLTKSNNTEGICYDPEGRQLLIACKNESGDDQEKKSARAIYAFDPASAQLSEEPFLLIHKKDFKELEGEKLDFYPSAVAVHPITHNIYVLSTRGTKCMAEYSRDGKLIGFQFINPNEMLQPEGICFAPDGTLYISTEGKHGVPAMIYEFGYKGGQ